MKKLLVLAIIIVSAIVPATAQSKKDSLAVVQTFNALLKECKAQNNAGAAAYILNTGEDEAKKFKVFLDYKDPSDKKEADTWIKIIKRDILGAKKYTIKKYRTENESEGTWHILTISGVNGGKSFSIGVAFLKVGEKFGLADID